MPSNVLTVEALEKRYGSVEALRGLSFNVPEGAFFGLFGRNGAGKTTTLDIVTGLLARDAGRVTVLGEEMKVEPEPETKARFGYVAGHLQLYDWMTSREHIEFVSKFYPTWDSDRERQLRDMFRLPLDRRVGTLSAGQYVQIQLVLALAHHPELLIIDEPGNLDAVVRQQLMATMIRAIADQETTVIMASHIISELDGVCDHLCIIDEGVALASGPVEDLADSVRRIHLRVAGPVTADDLDAPGILSLDQSENQVRIIMADYTDDRAQSLAHQLGAEDFQVERLGLQELFVALTARDDDRAGPITLQP